MTSTHTGGLIAAAVRRDRHQRRERVKVALARHGISLATYAAGGWLLMIAVGNVHADWLPACPTIGYGPAFLLVVTVVAMVRIVQTGIAVFEDEGRSTS